jgi:uncharacterized membrane protein
MKYVRLIVLMLPLAFPAVAQDHPQLYAVTNVAAGDVLNVREAASGTATIIGELANDATGVEVLKLNATRRWGKINVDEGTGWVAMRFLEPMGRPIDHFNLPVGLRCLGTEPFWSLTHGDGALQLTPMDGGPTTLTVELAQDTGIPNDLRRLLDLRSPDGPASGFIYPATCSDGMSDRIYGLSISLNSGPGTPLLSGCCTLAP